MSFHIPSYSKVHTIGHKEILGLFEDDNEVTEKCDGSFGSCCKINGQFYARSKGEQIVVDAPQKLFTNFINNVFKLDLYENWIYYGEVLQSPCHNALKYNRTPKNNFILFGIDKGNQDYLPYEEMKTEGERIGLEVVPLLFYGKISDFNILKEFLNRESILGGTTLEGVVCKNFNKFTRDGKTMMGKFVSEQFKETNKVEWRKSNPTQGDVALTLIQKYKNEARFLKGIQHLREKGQLDESVKDIGPLMKEIRKDIFEEEKENIKEDLFKHFWPKIERGLTSNVPQWYKELLANKVFEKQ